MGNLLPNNIEELLQVAVKSFWETRAGSSINAQEGNRAAVIGGKTMYGFTSIIRAVALHCGFDEQDVFISGKGNLTIPGFFRPTKNWDALVIYQGQLIAAFELKSQVGSFGNNFNNRTEEAIGSATDLWAAYRENAYSKPSHAGSEFKKPFLGYLMLLQKSQGSSVPIKVIEHHFRVFPEFQNTSYAQRYALFFRKLVQENQYSSAALLLSEQDEGLKNGAYSSPSKSLSPLNLLAEFAAHLLAIKSVW